MKNIGRSDKKYDTTVKGFEHKNENFDEMVEKQLMDDFKVFEYLNQNPPDGKNTEQYIALYNKLLVKKKEKNSKKKALQSTHAEIKSKNHKADSNDIATSREGGDFYYSEEEYQSIKQDSETQQQFIEGRTEQEQQMKKILWKQIAEKKKSLNLLKGDIGHLIARNQSITMLESKVNKVRLVSQSQLKRVSMALGKDWEQVEQRQSMQKKFHQKLKYVESFEKRNLKKFKNSYIDGMKRKKQIHDKLLLIQKECASIDQYTDKERQYFEKNIITKQIYELMQNLCGLIDRVNQFWEDFCEKRIDINQYSERVKSQFRNLQTFQNQKNSKIRNCSTFQTQLKAKRSEESIFFNQIQIDQINNQMMFQYSNQIVEAYHKIDTQIQEKKKMYNSLIDCLQFLWQTLIKLDLKTESMNEQMNIEERNQLNIPAISLTQYIHIFRHLEENVKAICFFLYFLKNKVNNKCIDYKNSTYASKLYQNCLFHCRILSQNEEIQKYQSQLNGQLGFKQKTSLSEREENSSTNQNKIHLSQGNAFYEEIFNNITQKIPLWFELMKIKKFNIDKNLKGQKQSLKGLSKEEFKIDIVDSEEFFGEKQNDEEEEDNQAENNYTLESNQINHNKNDKTQHHMHIKQEENVEEERKAAKRVLLLENIDQTYYKMIKETLQMEKENTRKNYEFQKNFKRSKYSSQDEILEQKRFESTFSGLFKPDSNEQSASKSQPKSLNLAKPKPYNSAIFLSPKQGQKTDRSMMKTMYARKKTPDERLILMQGKVKRVKLNQTHKNSSMSSSFHKQAQKPSNSVKAQRITHFNFERRSKKKFTEKLKGILNQV